MNAAPVLALQQVAAAHESAAGAHVVFEQLSLEVGPHDLLAVVGESGCGKTTLLRVMAGLHRPSGGRVLLNGAPHPRPDPAVALVFQDYGTTLLPWRTALENVLFGPAPGSGERERLRAAARELLDLMKLGDAALRYPWELSGGMQQRVAIARALLREPAALLLDEPWSALDEATRASLNELLLRIHRERPCAIVLVSHDLENVVRLARRVLVLRGRPARAEELLAGEPLTRGALRDRLAAGQGRA